MEQATLVLEHVIEKTNPLNMKKILMGDFILLMKAQTNHKDQLTMTISKITQESMEVEGQLFQLRTILLHLVQALVLLGSPFVEMKFKQKLLEVLEAIYIFRQNQLKNIRKNNSLK